MQKFFKWIVCLSFLCFASAQVSLAADSPKTQATKQKTKKKVKNPAVDAAKAKSKDQSKKVVTGATGKKQKKLNQKLSAKPGLLNEDAEAGGSMPEKIDAQLDLKSAPSDATAFAGLFAIISFLVWPLIIVGILMLVSGWKIFVKAGREGWESLIPILNVVRYVQIAHMPIWSIAFFFLPFLNMIYPFWMSFALAKSFNKSTGFALGLAFMPFVFYPILAFGDSKYGNTYDGQASADGFSMAS